MSLFLWLLDLAGLIAGDSPFGTLGEPGSFVFEFSRPLRTADHFQQVRHKRKKPPGAEAAAKVIKCAQRVSVK